MQNAGAARSRGPGLLVERRHIAALNRHAALQVMPGSGAGLIEPALAIGVRSGGAW